MIVVRWFVPGVLVFAIAGCGDEAGRPAADAATSDRAEADVADGPPDSGPSQSPDASVGGPERPADASLAIDGPSDGPARADLIGDSHEDAADLDAVTEVTPATDVPAEAPMNSCLRLMGMIGWWDADSRQAATVRDLSAHANDGNIEGLVPTVGGRVGQAFQFGHIAGVVAVPNASVLASPKALTLEAWIRPRVMVRSWWRVVGRATDNDTGTSSYLLGLSPEGTIYFGLFANEKQTYVTGETAIPVGQWSHIAAVWDGTTMRTYLNGVQQVATAAFAGPLARPPFVEVRLGRGTHIADYIFDGDIDEVSMYDRALTDSELAGIVTAGGLGKCKDTGPGDW